MRLFAAGRNHGSYRGKNVTGAGYIQLRVEALRGRELALAKAMVGGNAYPHNHWILEHRLVKAMELKRPLERHEVVHHINGVKDDNRPSNLRIGRHCSHKVEHHQVYAELQALRRENEELRREIATLKRKGQLALVM